MKSGTVFLKNPLLSDYSRLPVTAYMKVSEIHDCLVMYICVKEKIDIEIGNTIYFMDEKSIALIESGTHHNVLTPITEEHKIYKLFISNLHLTGYEPGRIIGKNEYPIIDMSNNFNNFFAICNQLFYEHQNNKHGELSVYLLNALLLMAVRIIHNEDIKAVSNITENVKAYIEEHLNEDINLTRLSSHIYVSSFHIIHTFKKEMGISPIQYLILKRMEKAKELLTVTDKTVAEISSQVGYANANYFNMLFKKTVGISPGRYRKAK